MNKARRDRQRARERKAGGHTQADHKPGVVPGGMRTAGPVNCLVCRPGPRKPLVHGDGERWRA
jgi:hypothetical protein